jgi:hypothetical protein
MRNETLGVKPNAKRNPRSEAECETKPSEITELDDNYYKRYMVPDLLML